MLDVFFTVDVEVWCDGWTDIDRKFPQAFRQYIYGPTARGPFGLPYQLDVLRDHGLSAVFFVEPLFSTRFGGAALEEVVGLLSGAAHEVQLHLHTEWVDEAREPLLRDGIRSKRQHLRQFSLDDQTRLIGIGADLLARAGARDVHAFRAGSFALNHDTPRAVAANRITFDSSYNASVLGSESGVLQGVMMVEPIAIDGTYEYPMTVFRDGMGAMRHAQLGACSAAELEGLLWQALEMGRRSFVLLSHSFELLNQGKNRPDDVVVKRFRRLCGFLDRHRDVFRVRGFRGLAPQVVAEQPAPLASPWWRTASRIAEQARRVAYR